MDELQFRQRADAIYRAVLARIDQEDPDELEAELSAGVVRVRAAGGKVYILNHQAPLREIWYAAGDRAWHFGFDGARWVDPRSGDELAAVLGATLSAVLGRPLQVALPV